MEVIFFSFPRATMQVLSLWRMTSKLVSLVVQVTLHHTAPRSIPDLSLFHWSENNKSGRHLRDKDKEQCYLKQTRGQSNQLSLLL